jgi:geranylgeranyl diphosphate synthase, type II
MGAIYACADDRQLDALTRYGEHIGLAFQIVDDILDVEQCSEELGKTAGKDAEQHKITFPSVYGLERSREMAEEHRLAARLALQPFDAKHDPARKQAAKAPHRSTHG